MLREFPHACRIAQAGGEIDSAGEHPLYHPAKLTEAIPVLAAADGQHGHDVTRPETGPDGFCILRAVAQDAVGTTPGWSSLTLE